ncbi:MAG: hypothetical protein Q8928_07965 [Bacteroidota bacterium]|nr:hypothetical protein [Bacteroidota bacterium]
MKSIYYLALLLVFATFGCNQKEKQEIARLNTQVQSLMKETSVKDSSINEMLQSLNQIESNLTVIKQKEAIISEKSSNNKEMNADVRARINDDIKLINDLMNKNKSEIARLNKQLKQSKVKIAEFEKMVAQLNTQIAEKDTEIAALKQDLAKLNFSVASLNATVDTLKTERSSLKAEKAQLQTTVEEKTVSLNTAYYVVGTKKQLTLDNIITKAGGLFSSTQKVKQNFDNSKFTKVDIRQLSEIPLNSKKIQIVSTHPADSYELQTNAKGVTEKLKITNQEKFWSASKYLVIVTQ